MSIDAKKGQTSVEYLLLVALVVGVSLVVSKVFAPGFMGAVQQIVTSIQDEAWTGGEKSANDARPYQNYYSNNKGICMHTDKAGSCN